MVRSNRLGCGLCLSSSEHIMGVSVSATKPDTTTAPARASANSVNNRPVRPGVKARGAYTATSVAVMVMTAKPISRAPRMLAENGSMPSSMYRKMFSSMTMASSTTRPIASTSASNVRVLMLKPASAISANVPTRLTGIVMMGMMDARIVRKNTKMTSATSTTASMIVRYTLATERSINTELSLATSTSRSAGKSALSLGKIRRTPSDSSSGFAVAWRITPTATTGRPFNRTAVRSSAGPSSTRATSCSLTGKPLTVLTTISLNCAG